jgi:hypothetical protein
MKSLRTMAGAVAQVRDYRASACGCAVPRGQRDAQILVVQEIVSAGLVVERLRTSFPDVPTGLSPA